MRANRTRLNSACTLPPCMQPSLVQNRNVGLECPGDTKLMLTRCHGEKWDRQSKGSRSGSVSAVVATEVGACCAGTIPLPKAVQLRRIVKACLCNSGAKQDAKRHSHREHDGCAFNSTLYLRCIKLVCVCDHLGRLSPGELPRRKELESAVRARRQPAPTSCWQRWWTVNVLRKQNQTSRQVS